MGDVRPTYDLVCFSHLRWDFVYQRPQHLLSRFARHRRVLFVEEPIVDAGPPRLALHEREAGRVLVVVPHLPSVNDEAATRQQRLLLDGLLLAHGQPDLVLWYYTPMALPISRHLPRLATVYDCMDELSAFRGAPPGLTALEDELLASADLVFTGGHSLYEAKRHRHANIHPEPSSVDREHFAKARLAQAEPEDQAAIPHPRAGFFGVIDERMDLELIDGLAARRPDLHIVMLGPVVKIDPASLPQRPNLHWLGGKAYAALPAYVHGWDVALLPFARNEATRFISPTKTPEYLAAGVPVVSTSIRDVVVPYGERGLVHIADSADDFAAAVDAALADDHVARLEVADAFLADLSWDKTFTRMRRMVHACIPARRRAAARVPARLSVVTP